MTNFSLTTGYTIKAPACLARHGSDSMRVREIAEVTEIPCPYLSKVFQSLGDVGIVGTKRGYKGGVKVARLPSEITLLEIDSAVKGHRVGHRGIHEETPRPNSIWEAFHTWYRQKLAAMTLAKVIAYETLSQNGGLP